MAWHQFAPSDTNPYHGTPARTIGRTVGIAWVRGTASERLGQHRGPRPRAAGHVAVCHDTTAIFYSAINTCADYAQVLYGACPYVRRSCLVDQYYRTITSLTVWLHLAILAENRWL